MNRHQERGFASFGTVLKLLILGIAVFAGIKVVPLYFNNYELGDKMREEAQFAHVNRRSEEDLRRIIFQEAQSLDIPIRAQDIRVAMGPEGVFLSTEYSVTVDFIVYRHEFQFRPNSGADQVAFNGV